MSNEKNDQHGDISGHGVTLGRQREKGLFRWVQGRKKSTVPDTISELAIQKTETDPDAFITNHERVLLSNILKLRELKVVNVMVPRADIVSIDVDTTPEDLLKLLGERQFSRIPVYQETLDDVIGTIHLKDVVATLARGEKVEIKKMITDIPIVSPSMSILNLLLEMRETKRHMALVVDEYGGIDGLVTIGDVIESIIGEIEDEHTNDEAPQIVRKDDGSALVDARMDIEEFEQNFGALLSDEDRKSSDTMAGLIFSMAGRIPARGEIISHSSGMIFEIVDADPRRVNILRVSHIPERATTI